jgi:predicted nuclease with TOPRIM domain
MAIIASQLLSGKKERDEEQLLQLFWNRAALKKEFAKLRGEGNQLTERLRQQEGANLRVQQRLEELEAMLTAVARLSTAFFDWP